MDRHLELILIDKTCLIATMFSPFAGGTFLFLLLSKHCRRCTKAYIDDGCPGYITHYYSWRAVHGILSLVGLIGFATFYFLFPETSHPGARGIDKMNEGEGINSSSFVFINPLEPLWLLRSPSMLLTVRFTPYHRDSETNH